MSPISQKYKLSPESLVGIESKTRLTNSATEPAVPTLYANSIAISKAFD